MICKICGREIASNGMPAHLRRTHKISQKEYYDTYIEPNVEHKCACDKCPNDTSFVNLTLGYRKYCCRDCARRDILVKMNEKYNVSNISQVPEVKAKMKKSIKQNWDNLTAEERQARCKAISDGTKKAMVKAEQELKQAKQQYAEENNLVSLSEVLAEYGSGYMQSFDCDIEVIKYKNHAFIHKEDADKIIQYSKQNRAEHIEQTCMRVYGKKNPMQVKEIQDKVKQTNLEKYGSENVYSSAYGIAKSKETKQERYGDENYNNREKAAETMLERYGESSYTATKEFKQKVTESQSQLYKETGARSKAEAFIVEQIKPYCTEIVQNKQIIGNKYLDIYIPELKIAVEHNGIYFHSIEHGLSKDYHLNKSLLCREKGIRLIHIYEFEDLQEQVDLLIDLIRGEDNYPKNDFNKNSLLADIPNPEIIYQKSGCTIYGAGKLVK